MATPNVVPRANCEGNIGTSLKKWTKQDWDYVSKKDKKKPKSKRGRYLPKSVRESLTPAQKAAENRKKRKARNESAINATSQ